MTAKIIGADDLRRKLTKLSNLDFLRPHIEASAVHIAGKVAVYPKSTAANMPKDRGSWYERGWGTRWRRRDGSLGGVQSSEDLGPSWKGEAVSNTRGIVGNDASYAPHVQGPNQNYTFKKIGWKTVKDVADDERDAVLRKIRKAVDAELAR